MKFDFAIGNPAYQRENPESNRQEPVYHYFMEEAFKIANVTEMITPARFLFDAGQTPKAWNAKILNDEHFKVLFFTPDATTVFPSTEIKGGVAVTMRNTKAQYQPIGVYTSKLELNSILSKVSQLSSQSLSELFNTKSTFLLTEKLYEDHPELRNTFTAGNEYNVDANIFNKMPAIFVAKGENTLSVLGRINNERTIKSINLNYIKDNRSINAYKVILPSANGAGKFGETLVEPYIAGPNSIHTQTFLHFGPFINEYEANSCAKFLKTKFARTMLGILKVTQNCPKSVWSKIPLQDFTPNSDIDWSASVKNIDRQLYKKYGLSQEEIDFIESNVKEMV